MGNSGLGRILVSSVTITREGKLRGLLGLALGASLGFMIACGGEEPSVQEAVQPPLPETTQTQSMVYPKLYTSASLPEYPNATLVATSLMIDGLELTLESGDPVQTMVAFYEEEMRGLGWDVQSQEFRSEALYHSSYTTCDPVCSVLLITVRGPEGPSEPTNISITFLQEP